MNAETKICIHIDNAECPCGWKITNVKRSEASRRAYHHRDHLHHNDDMEIEHSWLNELKLEPCIP